MRTPPAPFRFFSARSLASGSSGNAWLLRNPEGALLVDAGLSGRALAERVEAIGGRMDEIRLLYVTHDHVDHVQAAGVLHRRYGIPLAMTLGTWRATKHSLGRVVSPQIVRDGEPFTVAGFTLHPVGTPHDGVEPASLVVEHGCHRIGLLTDLGHAFKGLPQLLASLDAVFLESNYDPAMLAAGGYPEPLKRRIRSQHGHLSNEEAGDLLATTAGTRLKRVILAHLSAENNLPSLALATVKGLARTALEAGLAVRIAPRHAPSVELGW